MKLISVISALVLATVVGITSLRAQNAKETPDKMIDIIVGSWKIQEIQTGKKNVSKHPPAGHWMEFKSDGKYVDHAVSLDSGSYRTDENRKILYLESSMYDPGTKHSPEKIDEWYVTFKEEKMILQRNDNKSTTNKTKYVYTRIGDGSRAVSQ